MRNIVVICSVLVGASILYSPIVAQAKTAKECRAEWQADKTANQAKKITESAYIKECTTGGATALPAAAPTSKEKEKAAKEKTTTAPMAAPAAAPAKSSAQPAPAAAMAPTGANEYSTEAQAKARCGSGTVVWANLNSKIYHFAGHKDYGNTKSGAYMCERDATSQGIRAAKNEKHP